jgi:DNA-binding transcriptional MerR regulator
MRHLSATEVCELLSVPHRTLANWVDAGVIKPIVDPGGRGNRRKFSITDVLAVGVGRGLRVNGLSLDVVGDVTEVLLSHDEAKLHRAFREGRTCIMICGDKVFRQLVQPESILANKHVDYSILKTGGLMPIAVNVARAFDKLLSAVAAADAKAQKSREAIA